MRFLQAEGVSSALGATHRGPGEAGERRVGRVRAAFNALTIAVEEHFRVHNFGTVLQADGGG